MTLAPTRTLRNGVRIPQIGLGTWPMNDAEAAVAVAQALRLGYRLIDTAEKYGNETGVGEGIRKAGIPRDEIFVTTKFSKTFHSVDGVRLYCEQAMQRLGLDYLDLLLIHWPNPALDQYVDAMRGLEKVVAAGMVRAFGMSNFKTTHLARIVDAGLLPHVAQIQIDPFHRRDDLDSAHQRLGIVTESWSPIGRAGELLSHPVVTAIAQAHGRTPAQVVLRWHVEHNYIPLPKSADAQRQADNLAIFDFALTADERAQLDGMDRPDPNMLDSDVFGH